MLVCTGRALTMLSRSKRKPVMLPSRRAGARASRRDKPKLVPKLVPPECMNITSMVLLPAGTASELGGLGSGVLASVVLAS